MEEKQIKLMKKQLWTTRLLLLVMAGILAALVWFGLVLLPPVLSTLHEIEEVASGINEEVIPALAAFDAEALNEAIANFDATVQELDIEELNRAVSNLQRTVSNLNIDELNAAVSGLSSAVEGLSVLGSFLF